MASLPSHSTLLVTFSRWTRDSCVIKGIRSEPHVVLCLVKIISVPLRVFFQSMFVLFRISGFYLLLGSSVVERIGLVGNWQ